MAGANDAKRSGSGISAAAMPSDDAWARESARASSRGIARRLRRVAAGVELVDGVEQVDGVELVDGVVAMRFGSACVELVAMRRSGQADPDNERGSERRRRSGREAASGRSSTWRLRSCDGERGARRGSSVSTIEVLFEEVGCQDWAGSERGTRRVRCRVGRVGSASGLCGAAAAGWGRSRRSAEAAGLEPALAQPGWGQPLGRRSAAWRRETEGGAGRGDEACRGSRVRGPCGPWTWWRFGSWRYLLPSWVGDAEGSRRFGTSGGGSGVRTGADDRVS
jgi:hypothetical protein